MTRIARLLLFSSILLSPVRSSRRSRSQRFAMGAMGTVVAYAAAAGTVQASTSPRWLASLETAPTAVSMQQVFDLDIAPELLDVVIDEFEAVTGVELELALGGIGRLPSPGVRGTYSPEDALEITVIPSALIEEQGATTLREVLANVPGVTMAAGEGGQPAGDNLTVRGFSARNDITIDGVRDLGTQSRDAFNLEQVEVIKGPASAYSGRGSTGGSINLVSKTPSLERDFGSTVMLGNADPPLAFGLNSATRFTLAYSYLDQDNISDYGIPWVRSIHELLVEHHDRPAPVPRSTFYGFGERDYERLKANTGTVLVEHDLGDGVGITQQVRFGRSSRGSLATPPRFAGNDTTDINRELRAWRTEDAEPARRGLIQTSEQRQPVRVRRHVAEPHPRRAGVQCRGTQRHSRHRTREDLHAGDGQQVGAGRGPSALQRLSCFASRRPMRGLRGSCPTIHLLFWTDVSALPAVELGATGSINRAWSLFAALTPEFNRYEGGGNFGTHIDNAIRTAAGTAHRIRTDLSATLFLSDPADYDGGELNVEDTYGVHSVKLPAGDLVLYPASSLHHVNAVTRGQRLGSFFWVQSMVRDDGCRTLLFDLDMAVQKLSRDAPDHPTGVQLTGLYHNLLRRWAEV